MDMALQDYSSQRELEEEFSKVAFQAVKTTFLCYLANFVSRKTRWEVIFHLQPQVRPTAQSVEPVIFLSVAFLDEQLHLS